MKAVGIAVSGFRMVSLSALSDLRPELGAPERVVLLVSEHPFLTDVEKQRYPFGRH
jgi:hypothetical protein